MDLIITILSILVVALLFVAVPLVLKFLKVKSVDVDLVLSTSESLMNIVNQIIGSLNIQTETKNTLLLISQGATMGVKYAEQLYKSGQLPKEDRKQAAINFVKDALADQNVEMTAEREILIASVVESAVFLLPKTNQ